MRVRLDSPKTRPRTISSDFLSTSEGLQLNRAFAAIRDAKVRKKILDLVVSLATVVE